MFVELRELLALGPYPGESFFRLKVTGYKKTVWTNVSPETLERIVNLLEKDSA